MGDLDHLQQVRLQHPGVDWLVRADVAPNVTALLRAAHVALRCARNKPRRRSLPPPRNSPQNAEAGEGVSTAS